jgi:hypothetical protein
MSAAVKPTKLGTTPPATENFAPQPEDFGQVHKVPTKHLEWCETDVRDLKRFVWRGPLVFALASAGGSLSASALISIFDHHGADDPVPTMEWVMFGGGGIVAAVFAIVGLVAVSDHYSFVTKIADRLKELRY